MLNKGPPMDKMLEIITTVVFWTGCAALGGGHPDYALALIAMSAYMRWLGGDNARNT